MSLNTTSNKAFAIITAILIFATGSISTALAQPPEVKKTDGITFVSGGVGDESMAQLAEIEKQYDLKLYLVGQSGSYLSDIGITITDSQGKGVLLTTSDGPVLLANLPSGTYTVNATKNGSSVEQKFSVVNGQLHTIYLRFAGE